MEAYKKILIISDRNEIELVKSEKDKKTGEMIYTYRFVKSREKLGVEFKVSQGQLIKFMHNTWEEIE